LVKPRFPCHLQRFHFEPAVRRKRHGPAHWFSCEQAENNGEVRPALARPDIGHITAPHLIAIMAMLLAPAEPWLMPYSSSI